IRYGACDVVVERALHAVDFFDMVAGPVAGSDPPASIVDVLEAERIADRVLLLYQRRPAAVLEVVAVAFAHVGVANAAKVAPDVRHLVDEEGPRIQKADAVDLLPLVGVAPRGSSA